MRAEDGPIFAAWERNERPYPWSEKQFQEVLRYPANIALVGTMAQTPIAFAIAQCVADEAYLSNMMVQSMFRRQGWAKKILSEILIWSKKKGARHFLLDVDTTNRPAIGLYQALGFEIVEKRPKSYPNGEDAFLMKIGFFEKEKIIGE